MIARRIEQRLSRNDLAQDVLVAANQVAAAASRRGDGAVVAANATTAGTVAFDPIAECSGGGRVVQTVSPRIVTVVILASDAGYPSTRMPSSLLTQHRQSWSYTL